MFCSKRSSFLVNFVHENALRVVCDDHSGPYSELVMAKNECTIYQQNIKLPMKEIYKLKKNQFPPNL